MIQIILAILAFIATTDAQLASRGECPPVEVVQNFKLDGYLGDWYEIERVPNPFEFGRCNKATYGPMTDGKVDVMESRKDRESGKDLEIQGEMLVVDDQQAEGRLNVTFPKIQQEGEYLVLDTDYDNYAVVYSCKSMGDRKEQYAWIIGRKRTLPEEIMKMAHDLLNPYGIYTKYLMPSDQDGCESG